MESVSYKPSPGAKDVLKFLKSKAARVSVTSSIVQRELEDYSDKDSYDLNRIRQIEREIDAAADKIYPQNVVAST